MQILSKYNTKSLYHFENSIIVALKSDIFTFYTCQINKGDILLQFEKLIKIATWCCHTEISKINIKRRISLLLTRPQGPQGCQKNRHYPLNQGGASL